MKEKYIELLLKKCVNIDINKPLFISGPNYCIEFIELVKNKAIEYGIKDIYLHYVDYNQKRHEIDTMTIEELKLSKTFDKSIYNEYALKNACFLIFTSLDPLVMKDVDTNKFNEIIAYERTTQKIYREKQANGEINWTIAAIPNQKWADEIYPNEENNLNKLWDNIYDMCLIKEDDPIISWDNKFKLLEKRCRKLNNMNLKSLYYTNKIGTDFKIELPDNYIWLSAEENNFIANMPTEEIFTSPNRLTANGKLVSSKPLLYNNSLIDKFYLEFKDGRIINYDAKIGKDILKGIIDMDEGSHFLGEIALVDYNSKISKMKTIFKETLIDENASCHFAIGDSFKECVSNGYELNDDELLNIGLNKSKTHVDFMIGTKDLEILGITKDNRRIKIMSKGNIVI